MLFLMDGHMIPSYPPKFIVGPFSHPIPYSDRSNGTGLSAQSYRMLNVHHCALNGCTTTLYELARGVLFTVTPEEVLYSE